MFLLSYSLNTLSLGVDIFSSFWVEKTKAQGSSRTWPRGHKAKDVHIELLLNHKEIVYILNLLYPVEILLNGHFFWR